MTAAHPANTGRFRAASIATVPTKPRTAFTSDGNEFSKNSTTSLSIPRRAVLAEVLVPAWRTTRSRLRRT